MNVSHVVCSVVPKSLCHVPIEISFCLFDAVSFFVNRLILGDHLGFRSSTHFNIHMLYSST